jgi:hypothetical protein
LIRSLVRNVALLAAIGMASMATQAQAGFMGSYSITGYNTTSSTGGLTGNPTFSWSAEVIQIPGFGPFSIGPFSTTSQGTGGFSGVAGGTSFTPSTLTITSGVGQTFTFGNATYGMFTATSPFVAILGNNVNGIPTSLTLNMLGTYVGGAVGGTAVPAEFTLSFTQAGGPGNSISTSGTLVIPPPAVPEPASIAMLGLGLGFVGFGVRRSRRKVS